MDTQNKNSSLKAIIVVLALLLAGSLAYIFKMTTDAKSIQTELSSEKSEKDKVLDDLAQLKATYDEAIASKTALSDELVAEREKVVKLMDDLKKSNGDVASLKKYRSQYNELNVRMKSLVAENEELKLKNQALTVERDSTVKALGEQKVYNDTLVTQNQNLAKTVEKGQKLIVMNLRTQAYKERTSGKQVQTDRAGRANKLKVCFALTANAIAKSGEKTYYVQVIDSKNNVIGDKLTENFGDMTLTYSFPVTVNYNNEAVDVCEYLKGKEFEKGNYFVNIFDKSELVSKTSFVLK